MTGGLEHPSIIPVYGLGSYSDGRPYYAMRLIKGDNLREHIKRFHQDIRRGSEPFDGASLRRLLRRFLDVCEAIDFAHARAYRFDPAVARITKNNSSFQSDFSVSNVAVSRDGRTAAFATRSSSYIRFDGNVSTPGTREIRSDVFVVANAVANAKPVALGDVIAVNQNESVRSPNLHNTTAASQYTAGSSPTFPQDRN